MAAAPTVVKALPNSSVTHAGLPWHGDLCASGEENQAVPVSGPGKRAPRFGKSSKLLRHADFQRVYKQGRRHFAAHMTVFYLKRDDDTRPPSAGYGPRVGLTVGRVLGGAVRRNRIRRRLREAVRYNLAALALPFDVVINPKKSALSAEFALLNDEVARAFEKIQSTLDRRPSTKESG